MAVGLGGIVGRFTGYDVVRITVGLLLLTAAGLKTHQLATEPVLGTGFLDSRWLLMAVVEFELFFGLWLLANLCPKPTWAAALACFGLFTCVSLDQALSGHAICGCFGRVPVSPWYASILHLAIVVALLCWPPKGQQPLFPIRLNNLPVRVVAVFVVWLSIGVPAALLMWTPPPVTLLESDATVVDGGKFVVLEPEKWVGSESSATSPRLDYERTTYNRMHSETACGPLSLLAALDSMGVKVTAEERDKILQASGAIGTSVLQLKELAEEQGLHTLGVEIPVATLKQLDLHAIVVVDDIGFAAVTGYTNYGVQLLSPAWPMSEADHREAGKWGTLFSAADHSPSKHQ